MPDARPTAATPGAAPLTDETLAEYARLVAAATPGPWRVVRFRDDFNEREENEVAYVRGLFVVGPYAAVSSRREADFIAAAPDAVGALLAEVTRLRADAARLDRAGADVLLAFHDYPEATLGEVGEGERRYALNQLADAIHAARATTEDANA